GLAAALLHVHGGRLVVDVVHPAKTLREDRAVGLDRGSIASLHAVAVVVAAHERALYLGRGVEDQARDLLVVGGRIQLLTQPPCGGRASREIDVLYEGVFVPSRGSDPFARGAKEEARPQGGGARAQVRIVVGKADLP